MTLNEIDRGDGLIDIAAGAAALTCIALVATAHAGKVDAGFGRQGDDIT